MPAIVVPVLTAIGALSPSDSSIALLQKKKEESH